MELRHQRNSDAFFDLHDENKRNGISEIAIKKIYNVIETMLPKAVESDSYRLMEIFGEERTARNGWMVITEDYN